MTNASPTPLTHAAAAADVPIEVLVLVRALRTEEPSTYAVVGTSDDAVRSVVAALDVRGWASDAAPSVLLTLEDSVTDALATAGPTSPAILAVRRSDAPDERPWPGWDEPAQAAGYVGCLRTADWCLYAHESRVDELGPVLSFAPSDRERWPDGVSSRSRSELVDEIVYWRTAALTRWAKRAAVESGRTNKELKDEVAHLHHLLNATYSTVSWRVTAPLRAVQSARLRAGRK
ncbi:hypothetical protein [Cellulomonas sp.]|uniref:hypothetical protein n=1 Tax=Cellulomonas sp. TaxID=40001 RepID=UPI003BA948F8